MTDVKTQPAPPNGTPVNNGLALMDKNIADSVMQKIKIFEETGTLNIPKGYSAPNAIRVAWLIIQDTKNLDKRPVLEVCTRESVANALLKMILQGLNPVKHQCSFIAYGNQLTMQREYQGTIAIAKRDAGLTKVVGNAIFKDDVFNYTIDVATGVKTVTEHTQTLDSMMGEVKGAYAIKLYEDGHRETEIMTMSQIRMAWAQGPTKGESPAHKKFPDQMAVKTVINRALKTDVNSSDDSTLLEGEDQSGDDVKMSNVKHRISENANKIAIGFEEAQEMKSPMSEEPAIQKLQSQQEPVLETGNPGF